MAAFRWRLGAYAELRIGTGRRFAARLVEPDSSPRDRVAYTTDGDTMSLDRETLSAIVAFLFLLVMIYIGLDAARDKDKK
jgi:hypothetical protein